MVLDAAAPDNSIGVAGDYCHAMGWFPQLRHAADHLGTEDVGWAGLKMVTVRHRHRARPNADISTWLGQMKVRRWQTWQLTQLLAEGTV
mgnify:CR=1 FL=1